MIQIVHLRIPKTTILMLLSSVITENEIFSYSASNRSPFKFYKILNIEKMFKEIIMLFVFTILHAQYTLNLDFPFLLDNLHANITTVKWDKLNGFHVAFQNKQYRHYSFDFSNYTS